MNDVKLGYAEMKKDIFNPEMLLPTVIMQQLMKGAVHSSLTGNSIDLGFDPDEILQNLNLSTDRKSKMLKPIKKESVVNHESMV